MPTLLNRETRLGHTVPEIHEDSLVEISHIPTGNIILASTPGA